MAYLMPPPWGHRFSHEENIMRLQQQAMQNAAMNYARLGAPTLYPGVVVQASITSSSAAHFTPAVPTQPNPNANDFNPLLLLLENPDADAA